MGDQKREVVANVVLGTVEGDLHEIGKTLVATMLTANGFKVKDIGVDQPASAFVDAVKETDATIIGASALLTTTMLQQKADPGPGGSRVAQKSKSHGWGSACYGSLRQKDWRRWLR